MKKWHMESIINIAESTTKKLAVPDAHQIPPWSTAYSFEPRKEFLLIQVIRRVVAFFVTSF